jgi:hypothetical protein
VTLGLEDEACRSALLSKGRWLGAANAGSGAEISWLMSPKGSRSGPIVAFTCAVQCFRWKGFANLWLLRGAAEEADMTQPFTCSNDSSGRDRRQSDNTSYAGHVRLVERFQIAPASPADGG